MPSHQHFRYRVNLSFESPQKGSFHTPQVFAKREAAFALSPSGYSRSSLVSLQWDPEDDALFPFSRGQELLMKYNIETAPWHDIPTHRPGQIRYNSST